MNGEYVEITTPDGVADAYLVRPDEQPGHHGVLFIMDAFGLRPRIAEMADQIAGHGYVVLAPNVFYRAGHAPVLPMPNLGDPESRAAFFQSVRPLMANLTPERLAADGAAYLDYLATVATPPFGITGYCLGGRLGLRIATGEPDRVAAVGAFHAGGLVTDAEDSPHRAAPAIRAELYFGHADNDPSNSREQIATLQSALDEAGVRYRSELYEGAAHGYTMSDTAAYDAAATERHFRELFALLERTLASS